MKHTFTTTHIVMASAVFLLAGTLLGSTTTVHLPNPIRNMGGHNMDDTAPRDIGVRNMTDMMHDMAGSLAGKTGNEFDIAFLNEMIIHHQGAVDMAQMVLTSSKRPELISLARDIIRTQEAEIKMMQNWKTEWTKTSTSAPTERGVSITGTISSVDTGCFYDAICSVTINKTQKIILITGGRMPPQQEVGKMIGFDGVGDLEQNIGKTLTGYVKKVSENEYTIYGDANYFVELKK
jgi:hypothetical protein